MPFRTQDHLSLAMQTTIKQVGPVEHELEITGTADDLAPEFEKALRAQRTRTQLKGFRPGKVPLSLVKKMYGEALAHALADQTIQDTYEKAVLQSDEYEVLGQPTITRYDYEMDGDLHAVVRFGVRPAFELEDLSNEQVTAMTYTVTDEEVEEEIERLRQKHADLVPVEDEPAEPEDLVVFDLQELDAATKTAIIGKRDEDQALFLDDPRLDDSPLLRALADALQGAKAGDRVRFHFAHDEAHAGHAGDHVHFFEASVKDVKRRDVPELDDDFVEEVTDGQFEDVEAFRAEIRKQIDQAWARSARQFLEGNLIDRMRALHPVPVPQSIIDMFLDSFFEDVKQRNDGELPPNFSEEAFRATNREEAERQARWMLIRDKVVETEELEVTEEDRTAFFEAEAERDGRLSAEQLQQFYQAVPQLGEQVEQRLLSKKVFDTLAERFELVEKDREVVKEELEEREAEAEAQARAEAAARAAVESATHAAPAASEEPVEAEEAAADADEKA